MPLGIANTANLAGWGTPGALSVAMASISTQTNTRQDSPQFSWWANGTGRAISNGSLGGQIDLTGYTSLGSFNNSRWSGFFNIYLPSSTYVPGLGGAFAGTPLGIGMSQGSTDHTTNITMRLSSDLGAAYDPVRFSFGGTNIPAASISVETPGAYTNYTDQWLTVCFCIAESSSFFPGWSGTTTGTRFARMLIVNSLTYALIRQRDVSFTPTAWPTLSSLPNPLPVATSGTNYVNFVNNWSTGYDARISNAWQSWGTAFLPLYDYTEPFTDTTWITTSPDAIMGTSLNQQGYAWTNFLFHDYIDATNNTYVRSSGQDLYSQASNYAIQLTNNTSGDFATGYSTTIIPRDST